MSVSISESLAAHQRGLLRRPAVSIRVSAARGSVATLRWERVSSGSEPDGPHAAAIAADGSLVQVRNASGSLLVRRTPSPGPGASFGSWTALASCAAGTGVALAASTSELLLASVQPGGLTLEVRRSADSGQTWTTQPVVAEASAIGSVAIALNPAGDACLFYTLGTTTALKRLRRTGGAWAGSGTNWSRSGSVASLGGVAACHDGSDFALLITGTEAATNHRRCWAVRMGDLGLPANAWSGLVSVAEADSASTVSFASPAIAVMAGQLRGMFVQRDSGPVASDRAMETRPMAGVGAAGWWSEPVPHEAQVTDGLAICAVTGGDAWCATPSGAWHSPALAEAVLDSAVTAFRYELSPGGSRCRVELAGEASREAPALSPGATVTISPGYLTAAGGESGCTLEFTVERVSQKPAAGSWVTVIEGSGAWEQARRWHAPQTWQSPGTLTRAQLFSRTAARAGLFAADASSPREPGGEWTSDCPAFAIVAGETAGSVLERLLRGIEAEVVPDSGLVVTGIAADDAVDGSCGGAGGHPVLGFELLAGAPAANWVRLQGKGRSADAFDPSQDSDGAGPLIIHDQSATSDAAATSRAVAELERARRLTPAARLRIPFDAARQLWDVVEVTAPAAGIEAVRYRVIGIAAEYRRGPRGASYEQALTLGAI